jgi:hypothetical protein
MPTDTTEKGLETLIIRHMSQMSQQTGCTRVRLSDPELPEEETEREEEIPQ